MALTNFKFLPRFDPILEVDQMNNELEHDDDESAVPREPNTGVIREPNTGIEREPNTGVVREPNTGVVAAEENES